MKMSIEQEGFDATCTCGKVYNWDEHIDGLCKLENPEFVKNLLLKIGMPDEILKIKKLIM